MKSLKQQLSSGYWGAAQQLRSRSLRRKIVAYVESYEDVAFWRYILAPLEDETRYFQVMLPDVLSLTKGKKKALMSALQGVELGGNIIACVDSDYDYLLQNATATSRQVNNNPFIFQTYTYAIENCHCYAPTLHEVCTAATLNDHSYLDLPRLLAHYSRIIYPLFLWNIHFYRLRREGSFSMSDFNTITRVEHFDPFAQGEADYVDKTGKKRVRETPQLRRLQNRVDIALRRLRRIHPRELPAIAKLPDTLALRGLAPDNTYLYVQGHHLISQVILPILTPLCHRLRVQRETEIQQLAVNACQRQNELSAYHHALRPIEDCLRTNYQFILPPVLPQYARLLAALRRQL
jgi:hypothetical protein